MGPGDHATDHDKQSAYVIGILAAENGYDVLTGGRNVGVMDSAMKGAKSAGGQTIAILPEMSETNISEYADLHIQTGMGQARNVINILSSDLIVAIGMGPGTASEISLAIKHSKKIILFNPTEAAKTFFSELSEDIFSCTSTEEILQYL